MAKYTTEVRSICETEAGLKEEMGYRSVNEILTIAAPKIFNFNFPIFDEAYRLPLEIKILKHYYTREIGQETTGLWRLKLDTKMNEIMPYYNQLYKSTLIEYNPLYDMDLTREFEGNKVTDGNTETKENTSRNSNNTTKNTSKNLNSYSDTPQGSLVNVDNDTYLTSATKDQYNGTVTNDASENINGTVSGTQKINDTNKYIEHIFGSNGGPNYSAKILEFRKTFLNIDMQVIDDLKSLFFMLW